MVGIGGTGVVTVSQILSMAAHLEGRHAAGLDQTGLSQKGGPVVSDLRLSREPIPGTGKASAGRVDLYLGLDLLGAANPKNLQAPTRRGPSPWSPRARSRRGRWWSIRPSRSPRWTAPWTPSRARPAATTRSSWTPRRSPSASSATTCRRTWWPSAPPSSAGRCPCRRPPWRRPSASTAPPWRRTWPPSRGAARASPPRTPSRRSSPPRRPSPSPILPTASSSRRRAPPRLRAGGAAPAPVPELVAYQDRRLARRYAATVRDVLAAERAAVGEAGRHARGRGRGAQPLQAPGLQGRVRGRPPAPGRRRAGEARRGVRARGEGLLPPAPARPARAGDAAQAQARDLVRPGRSGCCAPCAGCAAPRSTRSAARRSAGWSASCPASTRPCCAARSTS
jgi:hypothetical protein